MEIIYTTKNTEILIIHIQLNYLCTCAKTLTNDAQTQLMQLNLSFSWVDSQLNSSLLDQYKTIFLISIQIHFQCGLLILKTKQIQIEQ
ncbi:hypothetical protein pb186bvf_017487 [Paramecium bursaria]